MLQVIKHKNGHLSGAHQAACQLYMTPTMAALDLMVQFSRSFSPLLWPTHMQNRSRLSFFIRVYTSTTWTPQLSDLDAQLLERLDSGRR